MIAADRFELLQTQYHKSLQPDCPVRIHCSRQCTDRRSGSQFVQIRMRNCSERTICSVFLCIEGLDACGSTLYEIREVILAECNAAPSEVFGEERMIVLEGKAAASLRIKVLRVSFADGMLWRAVAKREETKKAPSAVKKVCDAPRKEPSLLKREETDIQTAPFFEMPVSLQPRPAPIVRHFVPEPLPDNMHPKSLLGRGLVAWFIILGVLVLLTALGAIAYTYLPSWLAG